MLHTDISESIERIGLLIKIGTVAKHIHAIFTKTDITSQNLKIGSNQFIKFQFVGSFEKDFIFLDAGSTTLALAAALEGPALQAAYVTNGIAHARMLVQKGCRTYLPGGQVRPITEAITGPETLTALQHYNFTKAFMGANGVSPAEGFTTPDPEEASIKTAALQRARERWFLVDNTKFDMVYSAVIGDIGCGAILTNHCPDPRYAQLTFVKECSV